MSLRIGTFVRTLYEHSETGVIVRPRKGETPPSPQWFIVRLDRDGARSCIHQCMLVARNSAEILQGDVA